VAQVRYSDDALASIAADIAKDATEWFQRTEPGRSPLTASLPEGVSRTSIGLPSAARRRRRRHHSRTRGLGLEEARRRLLDSGVKTIDYNWIEDRSRKPTEVLGQTMVPPRTPGSVSFVLNVVARSTLFVEYVDSDRPGVERLARELSGIATKLGIVLRLQPTKAVRSHRSAKCSTARLFARSGHDRQFRLAWLMKQLGRPVPIQRRPTP
jgi:hypothetical protein